MLIQQTTKLLYIVICDNATEDRIIISYLRFRKTEEKGKIIVNGITRQLTYYFNIFV